MGFSCLELPRRFRAPTSRGVHWGGARWGDPLAEQNGEQDTHTQREKP